MVFTWKELRDGTTIQLGSLYRLEIVRVDNGIIIDLFPLDDDDADPLGTIAAFDADVLSARQTAEDQPDEENSQ